MAAAVIFCIFLQAFLSCAASSKEACLGEWSTNITKYRAVNYRENSYVHVSCTHKNFKVDGQQTILCVNGKLPIVLPRCVLSKASCSPLKAPVFGSMKCNGSSPEVGSSCTFECQSTHYLKGTATRFCTEDLRWTGSWARCMIRTVCPEPPPLHQGTVTGCSPEIKPRYQDICYFRCNEGFRLVGPPHLTCRLDGRLTDDIGHQRFPRCEPSSEVNNPSVGALPGGRDFRMWPYPASPTSCQEHNGYCSDFCHQEPNGVRCSCRSGYRLTYDGKTCTDVNECHDGTLNKCQHLCQNTDGGFKCKCIQGYASPDGFRCEKTLSNKEGEFSTVYSPSSSLSCQVHNGYCSQVCHQEPRGIRCSCRSGYRLSRDNRTCTDVDECQEEYLRKCDHLCRNTAGSFRCICRQGYTSPDGFSCDDVDECSDDSLNKCDHTCRNTDGGYTCSCRAGFISPDGFRCEGCRVNSYRSSADVSCNECPADSHTDGEEKASINDCVCNPGFTGNPGKGVPCTDVDECADGKYFGCSHTCINTPGKAHCACPLGYQLKEDGKTCIDVDECSVKNGGCNGVCHNTVGNFSCSCPEGYLASPHDRYACDDVDECAERNGGCSDMCINFKGGFYCSCSEGYHIHPDGKTCIIVHCPRVSVPHHSTLKCKNSTDSNKKDIFRPGEMPEDKEFPVGASCKTKCDKGYDYQDTQPIIVCQNDGKWNASLSECRVSQCPPLFPPSNGDVYPASCKNGSSTVKEKCFFTCHSGYRITGQEVLTCRNNLTWAKKKPTLCVPETEASISCPDDDIVIELMPDEGWAEMQLNSPRTTLAAGPIRVTPEWVSLDRPSIFPAGETEVTFSVTQDNKTVECSMSVIVGDKHPPNFPDCPDTLFVNSSIAGTVVSWEEPVPQDNVGIASVSKSLDPNSFLSPGLHFVEYTARDFAGNVGQCIFHINVTAVGCQDLADPEKGEANCQEWRFGKICLPTCFPNYTRPVELFACDGSGSWTPADFISSCLPE